MQIFGLQKLTLLDYPEKMACTVFTGGCNFRCPFCHNASLVLGERMSDARISEEEFFSFLNKRIGILDGVCVSGGEPTLMPDIADFLKRIKELGFLVKLDTNGYRPDVLKSLVEAELVDFVAMDIKNSRERYAETTGLDEIDISKIEESVEFLLSGAVDFEFRTTLVKGLHDGESIISIGRWIRGAKKYYLQNFVDSGDLISTRFGGYDKNETESLLKLLKEYIPNAQIRG